MKFDKPQYDTENNSCDYLDLTISIKMGQIHTDLFRKETDKPRALLPSSSHPNHITSNIIFSMGFRLLRICSNEELFKFRLDELKNNFLIPRKYHPKIIDAQFKRVKDLPGDNFDEKRQNSLKKKEKKNEEQEDRVIAPIDFNPHLPKISQVLNKHFKSMLFRNHS